MSRRLSVLLTASVVGLLAVAPSTAAAQAGSVTATGTGQTRVLPSNRRSNASIAAAYDAARRASITGAIAQAHEYALQYAHALGMTLGPAVSVSDQQSGGFYGPGGYFGGPFGPGRFCGTLRQPVFKTVSGRRKVVRTKRVHRCIVPRFAYTTLSVTYAAT